MIYHNYFYICIKRKKMKYKIISVIAFFLISLSIKGQCSDQYFGSNKYPALCVENLIKWLNSSRSQWATEMNKYDFKDAGEHNGVDYYSTGSLHYNIGVQLVISKDYGIMDIMNAPFGVDKKNIFKNI